MGFFGTPSDVSASPMTDLCTRSLIVFVKD